MAITSNVRRLEAVHSTWLETDRDVTIYFPPGYDESRADRYPVLILHDGQNLFDDTRAHAGVSWRAAETADRLVVDGEIDPLVIVGIDHGQTNRIVEFTPTPDKRPGAGEARKYARFVIDELMPYLAREHGLNPRHPQLGLGGSSLGALVSLVIAAMYPGMFHRLIAMSPSVWWDKRVILTMLASAPDFAETRMWLDVGRKEGIGTVRDARRLRDTLRPMLSSASDLRYSEDPAGDHSERSWGRRFADALKFQYRPSPI